MSLHKIGTPIVGICGGFQIVGKNINDQRGIEGGLSRKLRGLGLLDVETSFSRYSKVTKRVEANVEGHGAIPKDSLGSHVRGYEIHMGQTILGQRVKLAFCTSEQSDNRPEGGISNDGLVLGTYIHGIFDSPPVRTSLLHYIFKPKKLGSSSPGFGEVEEEWFRNIARVSM